MDRDFGTRLPRTPNRQFCESSLSLSLLCATYGASVNADSFGTRCSVFAGIMTSSRRKSPNRPRSGRERPVPTTATAMATAMAMSTADQETRLQHRRRHRRRRRRRKRRRRREEALSAGRAKRQLMVTEMVGMASDKRLPVLHCIFASRCTGKYIQRRRKSFPFFCHHTRESRGDVNWEGLSLSLELYSTHVLTLCCSPCLTLLLHPRLRRPPPPRLPRSLLLLLTPLLPRPRRRRRRANTRSSRPSRPRRRSLVTR